MAYADLDRLVLALLPPHEITQPTMAIQYLTEEQIKTWSRAQTNWSRPHTRERAAHPLPSLHQTKYWSPVARVDNVFGDRNLVRSCPPMSDYEEPR